MKPTLLTPTPVAIAAAIILNSSVLYAQSNQTETIVIEDSAIEETAFTAKTLSSDEIQQKTPAMADSAAILKNIPGISINNTGGVSSLPAIRGLADDRLRIKVDGMDLTATCPNHMNPPMSYLPPSNIEKIAVYAGVTPVSAGGDSIGGSIIVESKLPNFSATEKIQNSAELGAYYRSNNNATGVNLMAESAGKNATIRYTGSFSQADNYKAGDDFKDSNYFANNPLGVTGIETAAADGHTVGLDEVASSAYETQDHQISLAYKNADNLFDVQLGYQNMPEQLYPNQRMDLLDNEQIRVNLGWIKDFDWGELQTRAYYEKVDHFMDFGEDKRFYYRPMSDDFLACNGGPCAEGMPMYSESDTTGFSMIADYHLSDSELLKLGAEMNLYTLDDYWTASGLMMAPNTFLNINNGQRDRYALFAELETQHDAQWLTTVGLRYEMVNSDADEVQGYNDTDAMGSNQASDSDAFNNQDRSKTDHNIDVSALARYQHDEMLDIAMGFARKVRSPNLYESYTWSSWRMAAIMNNFVGDGNGYVGNLELDPETAYTLSTTVDWHAANHFWQVQATPYYTYVNDYIDAVKISDIPASEFDILQYENQSARIYGIDLSASMQLGSNSLGHWKLSALVNYSKGKNRDTGDNLYNIMPLNGKFTLQQQLAGWTNAIEWELVDNKDEISQTRNEIETAGYGLLNLRASHQWDTVQVDLGVENVFDRFYYLPTGGAYLGQGSTMWNSGPYAPAWGTAVPGMGRSLYAGVKIKF